MSSIAFRRFGDELVSLIGKRVQVDSTDGKAYKGELLGIDEKLNMILDQVAGSDENTFKVVLNGNFVKEVTLVEKPFELRALSERLNRVFPGLVRLREDIGAIVVMEKIKVTQNGITEGAGLAAERVKSVFEEFTKEGKKQ